MNSKDFLVTSDLYASKEKRFVNFIIDLLGYYVLSFIIGLILGVLEVIGLTGILNFLATMGTFGNLIFGIIIIVTYFSVFEVFTQKTLGKLVSKTIVVMEDGTKPTPKDIFARSFCRLIPFEAFSFLGSDARGWHDSMSNTYVVDIAKFEAKKMSHNELDQIGKDQL